MIRNRLFLKLKEYLWLGLREDNAEIAVKLTTDTSPFPAPSILLESMMSPAQVPHVNCINDIESHKWYRKQVCQKKRHVTQLNCNKKQQRQKKWHLHCWLIHQLNAPFLIKLCRESRTQSLLTSQANPSSVCPRRANELLRFSF